MDPVLITQIMVGLPAAGGTFMAANVLRDFLKRVLGPLGDELGTAIANPLREWNEARLQRGFDTMNEAALALDAAGKTATKVPGRVLFPLLQSASLEEDADLRRMWAILLANAADSARADLTPTEALALQAVYLEKQDGTTRVSYGLDQPDDPTAWQIELFMGADRHSHRKVTLPYGDYRVMSDNLARLGLVQQRFFGATRAGGSSSTKVYEALSLSPLGERFIAACVRLTQ
jgi:hypothetical protein